MKNGNKELIDDIDSIKSRPDAERIKYIRSDRWINYATAQDAITRLNDMLT
jgi:hypothetical protein